MRSVIPRCISSALGICFMAALSACGGGDGAPATASPAAPSAPTAPTAPPTTAAALSASATSVTVTADVSDPIPAPSLIRIAVANPPATNLVYKVSWNGRAVASATFAWQSPALGELSIQVPSPTSLGIGTYSGSVQLTVCADTACANNVGGSPLTVPVTFYVINSSADAASFSIQTQIAGFDAHTADANPPVAMFNVFLQNVPASGLYILLKQPSAGFLTGDSYTESVDTKGQITVDISLSLVKPATLGSGYFESSVTFQVCYDTSCEHPLPGSPATEPIYYRIYLTEGVEYSLRTVAAGGISDLAYDTTGKMLYVAGLGGYATSYSGAVTQINPLTGATGAQYALSDSLFGIATSDDGAFVYVGSSVNPVVHRLILPGLSPDIDIPLGSSGDPNTDGGPNIVSELAVAPGAAHTLAVSLAHPQGPYTAGTVVFDDAVARPQMLAPLGYYAAPDAIAWGATETSLYVSRYSSQQPLAKDVATVTVGSNGLTVASSVSVDPAVYAFGRQFYGAGRAYDLLGHVIDVGSGSALGQFVFPITDPIVTLLPDTAHGRVFVLQPDSQSLRLLLLCYDDTSFALTSVIDLGVDTFDVALTTHLITWGAEGIAFNRNGVQILSGTFAAPPTAAAVRRSIRALEPDRSLSGIRVRAVAQPHALNP